MSRHLSRRGIFLFAVLVVFALAYLGVLASFHLVGAPRERVFGDGQDNPERLKIYIVPLSVDAVNDSMQVKVYVAPGRGLRGTGPNTPNRDLTINLINNDSVEQRVLRANEQMLPVTIEADLTNGDVADFPFDRYRVDLRFEAFEGVAGKLGKRVAEEITVWEGMLGYQVRSARSAPDQTGDVGLLLSVRRTDAQIFFALAAYLSMAVVALNALVIASLVFLGRRKVEATLTSALGALVFALPALRNALPGGPPLGVRADLLIFLWAELVAVLALALFVFTWARQKQ